MAFGIQTITDGNIEQIDGELKGFVVVQSGTATTGATVTFPATNDPLIFVRSTVTGKNCFIETSSTTSFVLGTPDLGGAFTYSYLVLAPLSTIGSSTHGIRIYNSAGQIIYDSSFNYITIDTIATVNVIYGQNPSPATITAPTPLYGTRYICVNTTFPAWAAGNQPNCMMYYLAYKLNSETSIGTAIDNEQLIAFPFSWAGFRTFISGYIDI